MAARGETFTIGDTINCDGGAFVDCVFDGATMIYRGGAHPTFENCEVKDLSWRFDGPALKTIQFLQTLGASSDGPAFIADLFQPGKYLTD